MKLGIYGGTFSPIHMGHVRAAEAFLEAMALDRLLVIPTAVPPHKAEVAGADAAARLTMARLAFADSDARLAVSDYEISREGKSYTVYTLEHFTAPDTTLYLLVGTDMFLTLAKWFRAEDIFRLADIVLMRRETDAGLTGLLSETAADYRARFGARIHEIDEPPLVISSTELRERLRAGLPTGGMLPDAVAEYIAKNNLYRSDEE
ncbi:MAG: nicotinate-nucleotide adenylyltransferase [Clostridia bacterium]|nr:nicotinate-nucleotide adenylyltransferase [Clostridia bacterium]